MGSLCLTMDSCFGAIMHLPNRREPKPNHKTVNKVLLLKGTNVTVYTRQAESRYTCKGIGHVLRWEFPVYPESLIEIGKQNSSNQKMKT